MPNAVSFQIKQTGHIARLTLCRPDKRNAMNTHFWQNFGPAVQQLSDGGNTRVLIVEAEGPVFSAGLDISMFGSMETAVTDATSREAFTLALAQMQDTFNVLEAARFPVIAAINGPCIGGAVDLISACDIRYGTQRAVFRIEEINVGMMADLGTLQRLPKIMAPGMVREMAFAGTDLTAARAKELGLLNEVFAGTSTMEQHSMQIARQIASKPPVAIAASKDALNHARDHGVEPSMRYMRALQAGIFSPQDIMQAITARMEGDTAEFTDLAAVSSIGSED